MVPLYIFLDLEAAHGDIFFGDIIEIAAQVDTRKFKDEVFHSLINTKQNLAHFARKVCRITKTMLKGKRYFPDVFDDFLQWILNVTLKCNEIFGKTHYPVLVAHGGFDSDFMMIQNNLERNEMNIDILSKYNLHFADTYLFARKLRSNGLECLKRCQLSIEKLFKNFFPAEDIRGQHRALPDVQFMMKIFLESSLRPYFDNIDIVSFNNRCDDYHSRNTLKEETKMLNENLPEGMAKVTHNMTLKRLLRHGLTHARLQALFKSSISYLDFYEKLKDVGIERKAAKVIASHLSSSGLQCEGLAEESDCRKDIDEDVQNDNNQDMYGSLITRTDSGYHSIDSCELTGMFYSMFSDEFFYPPERYEYMFGAFTPQEMKEIDQYIGSFFYQADMNEKCASSLIDHFQLSSTVQEHTELLISNTYSTPNSDTKHFTDEEVNDLFLKHINKMKAVHDHVQPSAENWEDEIEEDCEEYHIPANSGVLAKVVPIGMTMDNLNGKSISAKVPLFKHFEESALNMRPEGGIPKPTGKSIRQNRRRMMRENKTTVNLDLDRFSGCAVQAETGEVFLLV